MTITEITEPGYPLGTAWLPDESQGRNLALEGYIEQEYLITTQVSEWQFSSDFERLKVAEHPVATRVLIRRPSDLSRSSGVVSLEPLHPNLDRANTWRMSHDWITRSGHTWVGVTQEPTMAKYLAQLFPERYRQLSIPVSSAVYDLLGQVSQSLHAGAFGIPVSHVIVSGWSATGSLSRVYLQEGFLSEYRTQDNRPSINGVLIGISSGAAARAGYPPFEPAQETLPLDHPRRVISDSEVPVFEVLSEFESETHWPVLRPDSDTAKGLYRLYQVAGTSHANLDNTILTNDLQFRAAGLEVSERRISEMASDGQLSSVAPALYDALVQNIVAKQEPPLGLRLQRHATDGLGERTAPLALDEDSNALGGIRTPWVHTPLATYKPHSSPEPGFCTPGEWTPHADANQAARLVGHMIPLPASRIHELYPAEQQYSDQFAQAVQALLDAGYLLSVEAQELLDSRHRRWEAAMSRTQSSATPAR
ncbi:alpha/beta hydrolase domain-containing protein [Glutamicibacter sp. NPDC087344]|uniref:alpha/beta hydrolase domain-containing protein n=1 Tax=Glutamicibacter sp. NPDC087344 TaxID=3363994 RepID=UPI0037FB0D96